MCNGSTCGLVKGVRSTHVQGTCKGSNLYGTIGKGLRKKATISLQALLYYFLCIFAYTSISLLLFISIGYGPTHVSCKRRVLFPKLCGGGL
jgi:hypothetical protein